MKKDCHVIIGIIQCVVVTSLEKGCICGIRVAYIDMLMVRSNRSAGSRKEGTQGTAAMLRKKVQGCVFQDSGTMNSILRKIEELGLNASARHT